MRSSGEPKVFELVFVTAVTTGLLIGGRIKASGAMRMSFVTWCRLLSVCRMERILLRDSRPVVDDFSCSEPGREVVQLIFGVSQYEDLVGFVR